MVCFDCREDGVCMHCIYENSTVKVPFFEHLKVIDGILEEANRQVDDNDGGVTALLEKEKDDR